MYLYAQINDDDICIGISQLSGEVHSDDMIMIDKYDTDLLWRKYDRATSEWSTEKYEPEPSPELEDENTTLKLAMAELAEAYEQEKTELQLAIAELAEIVTGGAE